MLERGSWDGGERVKWGEERAFGTQIHAPFAT